MRGKERQVSFRLIHKSLEKLKVWKLEKYRQVEMTEWLALVNKKYEESKVAESIVFGEIKGKKRDLQTKVLNCIEGKEK